MAHDLQDRLRLEIPVLQAPMAGGVAGSELAAAVSRAGGLGSIGMRAPSGMRQAFAAARVLAPGRPIAMGLLVPFTQRAHVEAVIASQPDAVVLMAGFAPAVVARLSAKGIFVLHQVGSPGDAERALRDGADALIAQGVEAGGHVLGETPAAQILESVIDVAGGRPVVLSGGIANADDVRAALTRGASAALAGTRYLLTREAVAHEAYKRRVLGAQRTLLTELFGVGWPLKHRVVPNAATDRFCDPEGHVARWVHLLQRAAEPIVHRVGMLSDSHGSATRTWNGLPLFLPASLRPGQLEAGADYCALYAGQSAARILAIEGAYEVTRRLGGLGG